MKVVVIQPHFLPFIGYFDLMNRADIFVYYDTVQFKRRSWHCRTYISQNGIATWLSAPVQTARGSRRAIKEMQWADDQPWRKKMIKRLEHCYAHSKEPEILKTIKDLIRSGPSNLCDWNIRVNTILASFLNIKILTIRASELPLMAGEKQERIINLCQALGATHYICGPGSKSYIRDADFSKFNITLEWVEYNYPYRVPTSEGIEVIPSVLDLILLKGLNTALKMIHGHTSSVTLFTNNSTTQSGLTCES